MHAEIADLEEFTRLAVSIDHNAKGKALLAALRSAFDKASELGASEKAIIFTESRKTQSYLLRIIESGVDFEICIAAIHQSCRKPGQIEEALPLGFLLQSPRAAAWHRRLIQISPLCSLCSLWLSLPRHPSPRNSPTSAPSAHNANHGGKPWKYALIPHDFIKDNMSLVHLAGNSVR